jgi:DNA-binding beta-propeller fold protein YncE
VVEARSLAAWTVGALIALAAPAEAASGEPPLVLEAKIPLAGVGGRIDHMAFDPGRGRLIVAELGNGTVEAIDVAERKVLRRIDGLKSPQGVAYVQSSDRVAVASAGDGTVRLYKAEDLSPAGTIPLGNDADNIRTDGSGPRIVVGYGDGGLATIDTAKAEKLAELSLPAHPEGFQLHPTDGRVFVNLPDAHLIAAADRTRNALLASWQQRELGGNFPMAIDRAGATLASVFRHPARLVLMAASSGAVTANLETCGDADDVFFDEARSRLYVSCGDGAVDVFQRDPQGVRRIARIPTSSGARTSLFVPEQDRLYVAARAGLLGGEAAILVFAPRPPRA